MQVEETIGKFLKGGGKKVLKNQALVSVRHLQVMITLTLTLKPKEQDGIRAKRCLLQADGLLRHQLLSKLFHKMKDLVLD